MITIAGEPRSIGIVGFTDRSEGVVEMVYGIAPQWRRRGYATRGAPARSALGAARAGVTAIELRIGRDRTASQHVAVRAGFVLAGTVTQFVPGIGETVEDLRYVLERQPDS